MRGRWCHKITVSFLGAGVPTACMGALWAKTKRCPFWGEGLPQLAWPHRGSKKQNCLAWVRVSQNTCVLFGSRGSHILRGRIVGLTKKGVLLGRGVATACVGKNKSVFFGGRVCDYTRQDMDSVPFWCPGQSFAAPGAAIGAPNLRRWLPRGPICYTGAPHRDLRCPRAPSESSQWSDTDQLRRFWDRFLRHMGFVLPLQ